MNGDVGTNSGSTTGFNASHVIGNIHPGPDVSTAECATDLAVAYDHLHTLPHQIELIYPAQFGNDLVLISPQSQVVVDVITGLLR